MQKQSLLIIAALFMVLASLAGYGQQQTVGSQFTSNNLITYEITSLNPATVEVTGRADNSTDTDITIPGTVPHQNIDYTVTSIGANAFRDNQLTSVTIPNSVTSIGPHAFRDNQLTSVEIPNGVPRIEESAFRGNALTSVILPSSVTSIGTSAFGGGNPLTSVRLRTDMPPSLGINTFGKRDQIDVIVPEGALGNYQNHAQWEGFNSIIVADFTSNGLDYQITSLNPATVEVTGRAGNSTNTDITIPGTVWDGSNDFEVTGIGKNAFRNNNLTTVTIPNSVTRIGWAAFRENQLTSVTIGQNVTNIGVTAFQDNNLTSVTLPESVTDIAYEAFKNNPGLATVVLKGASPPSINANAFRRADREEIDLIVPVGKRQDYESAGWTGFNSINDAPPFVTTWAVEAGGSITIPINGVSAYRNFTYDFTVDWGDNTTTAIATSDPNDAALTHTYADAGTYEISIFGDFPALFFDNAGDKDKIQTVEQWGGIQWASMWNAFYGCGHLDITATDAPDLQNVSNMSGMFRSAGVTGQQTDINSWDVSNVTNMSSMFRGATNFNGNISDWDVSNVTSMSGMFWGANNFNADISGWNVSNVTNMESMFWEASNFNQDIGGWDVSNVTNMRGMFNGATDFNGNIGGWDVRNVTNMAVMFGGAGNFNQDIGGWDVSNVTNMGSMFRTATKFNGNIGSWDVSNVTSMSAMFELATSFNQDIGSWDVSNVTIMAYMFSQASNFNQDISGWNVGKVNTMAYMLQGATNFDQNIGGWDVSNVTNMGSMFHQASNFNQDIGGWNISKVTNMAVMLTNSNLSVANYGNTLAGWATLPNPPEGITLRAGGLVYNQIGASHRQTLVDDHGWDISGDIEGTFFTVDDIIYQVSSANTVTAIDYNTAGGPTVTIPQTVQYQGVNYSVTAIGNEAFLNKNLASVTLPNSVIRIGLNAFQDNALTTVEIPYPVTHIGDFAFANNQLTEVIMHKNGLLEVIERNAFRDNQLSSVDIPDAVTTIGTWAFINNQLGSVTLGANVERIGYGTFQKNQLANVVIPGGVTTIGTFAFRDNQLSSVTLGANVTRIGEAAFSRNQLTGVTIPNTVTTIEARAFDENPDFSSMTVEATDPPTLDADAFQDPGRDQIDLLVPKGKRQDYESAGWTGFNSINDAPPFITTWAVEGGGSVTIPIHRDYTYDFTVDWGDNTTTAIATNDPNDPLLTHNYTDAGTYEISIFGDFPALFFNNAGDKDKIQAVQQWGTIPWASMGNAFYGCSHLDITATDAPDLQNVANMSGMFRGSGVTGQQTDINSWDVSNVTNMEGMFWGATNFNGDIGGWDVSNVTNMVLMFQGAINFNQDIGGWDVSNVTNMVLMFQGATNFNQDIGGWNISNVTGAIGLNGSNLSAANYRNTLAGWATLPNPPEGITLEAGGLGYDQIGASHRQTLIDDYGWTITGDTEDLTVSFITTWAVEAGGSVTIPINSTYSYDFIVDWGDNTTTAIATSDPNDPLLTHTYADADTYAISIFGDFPALFFNDAGDKDKIQTVQQWGAIQWASMWNAFRGCGHLDITATDAPDLQNVADVRGMFRSAGVTGQQTDINNWDVSNVTNMSSMFNGASNFNGNISDWDVSNVTNTSWMFSGAGNFNQDIGSWNVREVTNMNLMFNGASRFNQDISGWDVSNVTFMALMFQEATDFNQNIGGWDVGKVNTMQSMFARASSFKQDISGWDVSNVTNMGGMFNGASSFNQDISGWDVSNATDMGGMFTLATTFNQAIGGWDVSEVTNMRAMFWGASNFNQDISGWDVSEVTDMSLMFLGASNFNQAIGSWDVSNITTMAGMLTNSGLSVANYGATLGGWAALPNTPMGIPLEAGGLVYDQTGAVHRQELVNEYGWEITGDAEHLRVSFITTWAVEAGGSVTIPINAAYSYNFTIDWGDDNTTMAIATSDPNDPLLTHTYAEAGTYEISISGDFPALFFNNAGDKDKIRTVEQWGAIRWASMWNAFYGCGHLDITATSPPDLRNVADMSGMFRSAGVTGRQTDLNRWNVSNVTNMEGMFRGASNFGGHNGNWNVSNVTNMEGMFRGASSFNQDISGWDVSNVTNMVLMFQGATNFNRDIGGWNISNVTGAIGLNGSNLSVANYRNTLGGWATLPNPPEGITLEAGGLRYDQIGATHRQTLVDDHGWEITGDIDGLTVSFITTWAVEAGGSITIPISGNYTYDFTVDWGDNTTTAIATSDPNDAALTHTYADAGTYEISIFGDFPALFFDDAGDKDKIQTVEQWGAIQWASMWNAFYGCGNLDITATDAPDLQNVADVRGMFRSSGVTGQQTDINSWDVSNVTNMSSMFRGATNFNGNISDWDVSNVTIMSGMFWGANNFNTDISGWTVSNVTNMEGMLLGASRFNQDIGGWDVSNVTIMRGMFNGATDFNQNIGGWDVSNVTNMATMFDGASSFNQDISGWDVSNVTNMGSMFRIATKFNGNIGGWIVSNVTSMSAMFELATSFNQDIGSWDVSNVTIMAYMFNLASNFNQDISGWDVGKVNTMAYMLQGAANFDQNIGVWDVSMVTDMESMFHQTSNFNQDIGGWDISKVTNMGPMLSGSNLSVANYGNTLAGWATLPNPPEGITLRADGLLYDQIGAIHRQTLINDHGWEITEDTEEDNEAPTVVWAPVTLALDENGEVTLFAAQLDNGSTDNRTVAEDLIFSFDAGGNETDRLFGCGDLGDHQVTLYVTDESENSATATALVTIVDGIIPTAIAKDHTVQLDVSGQAAITTGDIDNGSFDNCNIARMSLSQEIFNETGAFEVTLTVIDDGENRHAATSVVTVEPYAAQIGEGFTVSDIAYEITSINPNEVKVVGYTGSATVVEIPGTVDDRGSTYTVTAMGPNALREKQLNGVTIPGDVTSIGASTFRNNELTEVTIPGDVTSIGASAFRNNELTEVTIPGGVTSIGASAFRNNELTEVTIPGGVTSIGANAFVGNTDLDLVTVEATNPPSLHENAFTDRSQIDLVVPVGMRQAYLDNGWDGFKSILEEGLVLSIEDNYQLNDLTLYPNPARDKVYINIDSRSGQELKQVNIYTMTGAYLYSENEREIDTSRLSEGMYLFEIVTKTGDRSMKRVIIQ